MPIEFITVLNVDGSTISIYPKVDIGVFMGAVITAIRDALSQLDAQSIEYISTNRFHIYIYKTSKELLLLLATKRVSDKQVRRDLVNWFLFNLSFEVDEVFERNYLDVVIVDESVGSPLDKILEEHYSIFNEIEALYEDFLRKYESFFKIFGDVSKRLLQSNIDRLKLPIVIEYGNIRFREVESDVKLVANGLKELIDILDRRLKEPI